MSMLTDGTFERVVIDDTTSENTWEIEDVEFVQDGFSFTTYTDTDTYPIFKKENRVRGYIDDTVVADGFVSFVNTTTEDGEKKLRAIMNPP